MDQINVLYFKRRKKVKDRVMERESWEKNISVMILVL